MQILSAEQKVRKFQLFSNICFGKRVTYSIIVNQKTPVKFTQNRISRILPFTIQKKPVSMHWKMCVCGESTFKNFASNHLVCTILWLEGSFEIIFGKISI